MIHHSFYTDKKDCCVGTFIQDSLPHGITSNFSLIMKASKYSQYCKVSNVIHYAQYEMECWLRSRNKLLDIQSITHMISTEIF
jgi:hypothetical protein